MRAASPALYGALEASRHIPAKIIAAGFSLVENAISIERFPVGAQLGDPSAGSMSAAGMFSDRLRARGIV